MVDALTRTRRLGGGVPFDVSREGIGGMPASVLFDPPPPKKIPIPSPSPMQIRTTTRNGRSHSHAQKRRVAEEMQPGRCDLLRVLVTGSAVSRDEERRRDGLLASASSRPEEPSSAPGHEVSEAAWTGAAASSRACDTEAAAGRSQVTSPDSLCQ